MNYKNTKTFFFGYQFDTRPVARGVVKGAYFTLLDKKKRILCIHDFFKFSSAGIYEGQSISFEIRRNGSLQATDLTFY